MDPVQVSFLTGPSDCNPAAFVVLCESAGSKPRIALPGRKKLFTETDMQTSKQEAKLHHALITVLFMASVMFTSLVLLHAGPKVPLVLGCLAAGLTAWHLGYTWEEILGGMIDGISGSIEAILILLLIGMLVGSWIAAGTVPALICLGLRLVSARVFLPATMLICLVVAFAIGSWGTVGTIGLAFMGIGLALKVPAPLTAGAIVSGSYMGEVISPLSDATNLASASVGESVLPVVKKMLPAAMTAGVISFVIFAAQGLRLSPSVDADSLVEQNIRPLLESLHSQFRISPLCLLPAAVIIFCIILRIPAIPSMLSGALAGMLTAIFLQGKGAGDVFSCACSGYVSASGNDTVDQLLSAGGLDGMLEPVSIILLAMAFGGIMIRSRQMEALVRPVSEHLRTAGSLSAAAVITCALMNIILPDQYLAISMPGQMYAGSFDRKHLSRSQLGAVILGGGAVTSPLVPWNTCGIYCMSILSVHPLVYAPCAYFSLILPAVTVLFWALQGRKHSES